MRTVLDKIPDDATLPEVIRRCNMMIDKLNLVLSEIDEENLSESILKKINAKEEK